MVRSTAVSTRRLCSIKLFVERLKEGTPFLTTGPRLTAPIQVGRRVIPPVTISVASTSRRRRSVVLTNRRRPWRRLGPCVARTQVTSSPKSSPIAGLCGPTSHTRHAARPTAKTVRPATCSGRPSLVSPSAASIRLACRPRTPPTRCRRPDPALLAIGEATTCSSASQHGGRRPFWSVRRRAAWLVGGPTA